MGKKKKQEKTEHGTLDLKLPNCLSYTRVMGSNAYGYATPESDLDVRGFYVESIQDILNPLRSEKHKSIRSFAEFSAVSMKNFQGVSPAGFDVSIHSARNIFALWAKGSPEAFELLMGIEAFMRGNAMNHTASTYEVPEEALCLLAREKHVFFTKRYRSSCFGLLTSDMKKLQHAQENYDEQKSRKLLANALRVSGFLLQYLRYQFFELDSWEQPCFTIRSGDVSFRDAKAMVVENMKNAEAESVRYLADNVDEERVKLLFLDFLRMCGVYE